MLEKLVFVILGPNLHLTRGFKQEKQHNTTTTHYRIITSKTLQDLLMCHIMSGLGIVNLRQKYMLNLFLLHFLLLWYFKLTKNILNCKPFLLQGVAPNCTILG